MSTSDILVKSRSAFQEAFLELQNRLALVKWDCAKTKTCGRILDLFTSPRRYAGLLIEKIRGIVLSYEVSCYFPRQKRKNYFINVRLRYKRKKTLWRMAIEGDGYVIEPKVRRHSTELGDIRARTCHFPVESSQNATKQNNNKNKQTFLNRIKQRLKGLKEPKRS